MRSRLRLHESKIQHGQESVSCSDMETHLQGAFYEVEAAEANPQEIGIVNPAVSLLVS